MSEVNEESEIFASYPRKLDTGQVVKEVVKAEEILQELWDEGFSAAEITYIGELLRQPKNWDFPLKDGPGGAGE